MHEDVGTLQGDKARGAQREDLQKLWGYISRVRRGAEGKAAARFR